MGSTGTPAHEVQAIVPEFAYEIPIGWVMVTLQKCATP
jgi:hypothetical protein